MNSGSLPSFFITSASQSLVGITVAAGPLKQATLEIFWARTSGSIEFSFIFTSNNSISVLHSAIFASSSE